MTPTLRDAARRFASTVSRPVVSPAISPTGVLLFLVATAWLTACGSSDSNAGSPSDGSPDDVTQTVEFTATEYEFGADASTTIEAGDVVRFRLTNIGQLDHEMQVLDGNARLIDRIERLAPGTSGEVVLAFETAGQYQLICDIDDHLTRGQRAVFSVNEPVVGSVID